MAVFEAVYFYIDNDDQYVRSILWLSRLLSIGEQYVCEISIWHKVVLKSSFFFIAYNSLYELFVIKLDGVLRVYYILGLCCCKGVSVALLL